MYEQTDKIIKRLNRQYIKLFDKLKKLKFDELNVIRSISEVYKKATRLAKDGYVELVLWYYYDITGTKLSQRQAIDIVEEILEAYDSVTLYVFNHEVERKKARLLEALMASSKKNAEIKRALQLFSLQVVQFCDNITDGIVLKAYKDIGIKKVRWITEEDERVCDTCKPRHNKVYDINKVPQKTHYHCRCWLQPVKE